MKTISILKVFQKIVSRFDLYDCNGKVFRHNFYFNIGGIVIALGLFVIFYYGERYKNRRYWYTVPCILFALTRLRMHREFQKTYVDKVIYNTENQNFQIFKKSFFGTNVKSDVHKNLMLFTQDPYLNGKNINYINMETLECYMIGYTYAWNNQALFAHLLEQRITSIKK
ncbi:hypothetical protein PPERSA_09474 [Pseudocohnilembus persalinus]|uniref:Uncharacterized protein n=1 Tax=Pseudocohnilembus persalinus TaxID=266149 RepID=A0A0V0QRQ4_PSEPJ|nr:hypothetical protein PPERSA_09474 [Pseudocohnilembus persalinus]|eukprot:KRX04682.1 hypothetical protein PPERSA_09474 [Pseudocohnilembus persalinus]